VAQLSHLDSKGRARMVDVSAKSMTARSATARGSVVIAPATMALIQENGVEKGDVLGVARLAGIMGAKRTPELIPLCHPLALSAIDVKLNCDVALSTIDISATCKLTGRTGVEMEALTAVAVAALTVYDMIKAINRDARIIDIHLVRKSGGKSGPYEALTDS
jgi:cyclic pyranopterin phosphate synthase